MLEEESNQFVSFLDDIKLDEYVSHMLEDGTWGTQLEIVALCRRYRVHCVIFRPDGLHYRIECDNVDDDVLPILMLSHHDEEHLNEVTFEEVGRKLQSFNELELLLVEDSGPSLSKREQRRCRKAAPQVSHKLVDL